MKQIWFHKKLYVDGLRRLRMVGLTLLAITVILTLFLIWTSNLPAPYTATPTLPPCFPHTVYIALCFWCLRRSPFSSEGTRPIFTMRFPLRAQAFISRFRPPFHLGVRHHSYHAPARLSLRTAAGVCVCARVFCPADAVLLRGRTSDRRMRSDRRIHNRYPFFGVYCIGTYSVPAPLHFRALLLCADGHGPAAFACSPGLLFDVTLNIPVMWFLDGFLGIGHYLVGSNFAAKNTFVSYQAQIYTLVLALLYLALGPLRSCDAPPKRRKNPRPAGGCSMYTEALSPCRLFLLLAILVARDVDQPLGSGYTILSIFAVLVYFLYELITTKRFKNLLSALYVLPIPVLLCWVLRLARCPMGTRRCAFCRPPLNWRASGSLHQETPGRLIRSFCNRNSHLQSRSYCSLPRTAWIIRTKAFAADDGAIIKRSFCSG